MKLYQKLEYLSYWFRYQATYYEMKYHLKLIQEGKIGSYLKQLGHYDRNIGKSVALARLSAKYNIPILVPTYNWKSTIENDIVRTLPKYFKKNKPYCIVVNEQAYRGKKFNILLVEETLSQEQIFPFSSNHFLGYQSLITYHSNSTNEPKI